MTSAHPTRIDSYFQLALALIAAVSILAPSLAHSQKPDAFASAIEAFKAGKIDDARASFLELESQHPNDPTLLLNLGLIATKEKRFGAALGLWRKGLAHHPTNDQLLNAVDWARPKLAKSEITRDFDLWEEVRRVLIVRVSPVATTIVSALFFVIAGALFLRWYGARRRAIEEEVAMPSAPFAAVVLFILFIFLFGTSIAMFVDRLEIRGTIVAVKTPVLSAPDMAATPLFDLFEGMEVIVRDTRRIEDDTWRRIYYPGGNTGWVRDRDVLTSVDPSARAFAFKLGDGT